MLWRKFYSETKNPAPNSHLQMAVGGGEVILHTKAQQLDFAFSCRFLSSDVSDRSSSIHPSFLPTPSTPPSPVGSADAVAPPVAFNSGTQAASPRCALKETACPK